MASRHPALKLAEAGKRGKQEHNNHTKLIMGKAQSEPGQPETDQTRAEKQYKLELGKRAIQTWPTGIRQIQNRKTIQNLTCNPNPANPNPTKPEQKKQTKHNMEKAQSDAGQTKSDKTRAGKTYKTKLGKGAIPSPPPPSPH